MGVRTRFAPSPTGFLHVGGVRTALFSWLFARHHQGEFVLRIEDTDAERSTRESVDAILEGMRWLGLDWDEGPFFQTARYERYREVAQSWLDAGIAYRCTCSKERLETLRAAQMEAREKPRYDGHCRDRQLGPDVGPHVVRFKNPLEGVVSFADHVYGDIHVDNRELDDLILIRTDGHPTYNFAVVIDDFDMRITHVIRGDDHINNTPRQINLFRALNAPVPEFAHLPMILGEDGKRLSKRHGAVSVLDFREAGVLPHALLNYLVRLGWSSGDREIFSLPEMIEAFDLTNVSRGVSGFNHEKLYWLNQHYQRTDSPESTARALLWHFEKRGVDVQQGPALENVVSLQAERCKTLEEMCEKSLYFYTDALEYDDNAVKKYLRPVVLAPLVAVLERLRALDEWEPEHLQECINDISAEFDINMGKIAQPLRVAVTGSGMSPAIDVTLAFIGKKRVIPRIEHAIMLIEKRANS